MYCSVGGGDGDDAYAAAHYKQLYINQMCIIFSYAKVLFSNNGPSHANTAV